VVSVITAAELPVATSLKLAHRRRVKTSGAGDVTDVRTRLSMPSERDRITNGNNESSAAWYENLGHPAPDERIGDHAMRNGNSDCGTRIHQRIRRADRGGQFRPEQPRRRCRDVHDPRESDACVEWNRGCQRSGRG
jgi:hypothetical protein